MEQMVFFLALIAGFLFGGAIVWLVQRSDIRQAYDRARGELSAQLAGSTERTKSHEARIAELRAELDERDRSLAEMHETVATLKAGLAEKPAVDDGFVTQILERVQSKLDSIQVPEFPVPVAMPEPVVLPDWSEVLQPLQDSIHNVEVRLRGIDESLTPDRHKEVAQLTKDLQVVRDLGNSVYEALLVFGERFAGIGKSLDLVVECHNEAAIHLENRVIATARRFHQRAPENPAFDLAHVAEAVCEPQYQPAALPLNGK